MPQRIQLLTSAGHVVPDDTHLIDPAEPILGGWACGIRQGRTAQQNQAAFRAWVDEHPDVAARIRATLRGLNIGCTCPTGLNLPNVACLGDVVLAVANSTDETKE